MPRRGMEVEGTLKRSGLRESRGICLRSLYESVHLPVVNQRLIGGGVLTKQ